MRSYNINTNAVHLNEEEDEAVSRGWSIFLTAKPEGNDDGEWYAPKEVVETLQRTIAADALITLAGEYLKKSAKSSEEKSNLFEKAESSALKSIKIDPYPLNYYKVGNIFEAMDKKDEAKLFFKEFSEHAMELIENSEGDLKTVLKRAFKDVIDNL